MMRPKGLTTVISLALMVILAVSLIAPSSVAAHNSIQVNEIAPRTKVSPELDSLINEPGTSPSTDLRVIVQTRAKIEKINDSLTARGGRVKSSLPIVGGYVAELPASEIAALTEDDETIYVSLDRETTALQTYDQDLLRRTTGASNVSGRDGLGSNSDDRAVRDYVQSLPNGPNGRNLSIAVFDSGIYDCSSLHEDLRVISDASRSRVVARQNFIEGDAPRAEHARCGYDPYGHGTHVAGIAAGSGRESIQAARQVGNIYSGLAFNADVIDLRVIGSDGTGHISDTIAAIDWMVRNRNRYNIRVANFSIGAPVTQSYKTDPLCQALERAVNAGIVCVVAAGNFGKDDQGKTVYGGILAPANHPLALTVGAVNTQGSVVRSDDAIGSYSSRGPTLVDFCMKPDLVAPGTLIRSIAADKNTLTVNNNLTVYSDKGKDVYMSLSGTSMAAPTVAGTVALMLDANPGLTPSMVKSILQFTAQPLASLSNLDPLVRMLTEGAGNLNADAAVRLASAIDPNASRRANGESVLKNNDRLLDDLLYSSRNSAGELTSNIAGQSVTWGNNILYSNGFAYGYDRALRLSAIKVSGWQVNRDFTLFYGYL
ncbi:MAG TPA: S8 family serine peptidase, partial [Blastocatellia bacterium]|nr:S8 family serine peptidase [Blastocatellia bacterium]